MTTIEVFTVRSRHSHKGYPYCGAAKYRLEISKDKTLRWKLLGDCGSPDRRSRTLAEQDAEKAAAACGTEYLPHIRHNAPVDCQWLLRAFTKRQLGKRLYDLAARQFVIDWFDSTRVA